MNLTDIIKEKASIEDAAKLVAGDEMYLGYWSEIDGSAVSGNVVSHNSEFWQSVEVIVDITLSEPSGTNDSWFKIQSSVFDFTVSQYGGGDSSAVSHIYKGLDITSIDYLVWPEDGRIYSKNGATGTFTDPLTFDPETGVGSGITGTLLNIVAVRSEDLGDSSSLDTATAAEITAGTEIKVVTADQLSDAFIQNDETKAALYTGTAITPVVDATNTNDTDYDQYIFIQFASGGSGNADGVQISTDGGTTWVNFGHRSASSGMSNQITVKPSWAWRVRYTYAQAVEVSA